MNLKQLRYFMAVAEELHFGRAAERLGLAQPPLSRQIKQIEEDLGAILFNRGRNAVSLTQAGVRLRDRGRHLLGEFDDMCLEIRRIGQGAEGRLRIGFVGSATYSILPNIIKSFRAAYPDVALSLLPMNNARLYRALIGREIDVGFARPALKDAELITRKLMDEPLIAAIPDTWDTGVGPALSLAALERPTFLLYPEFPRPSYADFVLDGLAELKIDTSRRSFTMDLQTALSLVAIGEGICIVPGSVATAPRQGVRYMKIAEPMRQTALSVNFRIDEQGVHAHNFVTLAQTVARKPFKASA
ncbi:LysR family transcriptional regulator [Thioclava kandeliae]|uniref:LysR family transcriptional regulator n=1 Tax=Thioclava kandeliae TaxID=3070818 RepID=A0ABV1SEX7_9RHOB